MSEKYIYTDVKYIKNYDGDTIDFLISKEFDFGFKINVKASYSIKVRLFGIDTPEIRGGSIESKKIAIKAKDFVETALTVADDIVLHTIKDKGGKFGRYLAEVFYEIGEKRYNLSDELVKGGMAVVREY